MLQGLYGQHKKQRLKNIEPKLPLAIIINTTLAKQNDCMPAPASKKIYHFILVVVKSFSIQTNIHPHFF